MLRSKKIQLLLALLLVFSLGLTGCAGNPEKEPAAEGETAQTEKVEGEAEASDMKILIVTSPSGVDDGSFNQDNYNGIQDFIATHAGASVNPVQEPTGDVNASVQAVADAVAEYDVIVTPGFQFSGISSIADANPDKKFILVDAYPDPAGEKEVFDNVYAMQFAEEESGFLAGVAAALETKSGKVGVVNGIAFPSNVNYQFGFESGVNYAVKHLGATAEIVEIASYAGTDVTQANVGGNYVGSFADESTGKVVGEALIEQGVDVMLVAAGGSGNGVFTAAKEKGGVWIIGCDVDQYDDGTYSGGNVILTSVLKNMRINVERSLNRVVDGSFKGENALLKADTDSTGYVSAEGRQQLQAETIKQLDEVYAKLKDGSIVPASNFNGHTPEEFPGL
ncbi:MAG: BMP family ABC transporter substrate-binding protein [Tissierellia bacterium]|nr:BMP family ABC transporter substrate-binding protein [Tissierellia bacterium]